VLLLALEGGSRADLVAQFTVNPNPAAPNQDVTFDGSASYATGVDHVITRYEWDFNCSGTPADFRVDSLGKIVEHAFSAFGTYTTALRIIDNFGQSQMASRSVQITLGNHPPVADAGGPYSVSDRAALPLDGSGSYDPDREAGDNIAWYAWEVDGDDRFDDFVGETPLISYGELAAHLAANGLPTDVDQVIPTGLKVADTFGREASDWTTLTINVGAPVPLPGAAVLGAIGLLYAGWRLRSRTT